MKKSSSILFVFTYCSLVCTFQDCAEFFRDTRCGLVADTLFITSNTTWKKAESPLSYKARVIVSKSATLTIEQGVIVSFDILTDQDDTLKTGYCNSDDYLLGIIVKGKLVIQGQETDSVCLKPLNILENWAGITVESGASLDMQYVGLNKAGIRSNHAHDIQINNSSINWCSFNSTDSIVLTNNLMGSVSCDSCKEVYVFNNIFEPCHIESAFSNAQIKNNIFIQRETMQDYNWMLYLYRKKGDKYDVIVENNIVLGGTVAMIIWDYPASIFKFNDFFFNNFKFSQPYLLDTTYHDTDNTYSGLGIGTINNGNILTDHYSNIISDPFFKGSSFVLSDSSKCRDNGNPDINNNDTDGTRNDIGISGGKYPW